MHTYETLPTCDMKCYGIFVNSNELTLGGNSKYLHTNRTTQIKTNLEKAGRAPSLRALLRNLTYN